MNCDACQRPAQLICTRCRGVRYCSAVCQTKAWPAHKAVCTIPRARPVFPLSARNAPSPPVEEGYPNEPLIFVHDVPDTFVPPKKRPSVPIVFELRRRDEALTNDGKTIVPQALFEEQFGLFTGGAFAKMTPSLWANVVVAGGAVLGSLMPLEKDWRTMSPSPFVGHEDRDFTVRRHHDSLALKLATPKSFLQTVRWPSADVDVFFYGLSAKEADAKLGLLLASVSAAFKERGASSIAYVRTPNTVTVDPGLTLPGARKVQIITRLYASPAAVVNTFDLDACCFGFDGESCFTTARGRDALNAKLNIVNLQLRGAAYENRLVKYASRGFAVGIPLLDKTKIDRGNIAVKLGKSSWGGADFVGSGFSWSKWESSSGTLLRVLLMEQVARDVGYFAGAFPSRLKGEPTGDEVEKHHMVTSSAADTYPLSSKGVTSYPSTLFPQDILGETARPRFSVTWRVGNMPRTPLTWEEWRKGVYEGEAKSDAFHYDYKEERRKRLAKEKQQAEEAAQKAAAEAQRAANQIRAEVAAESKAALEAQKAKAKAALNALGSLGAQLQLERSKADEAKRIADSAQASLAALALGGGGGGSGAAEDKSCVICLTDAKVMCMNPCGHVSGVGVVSCERRGVPRDAAVVSLTPLLQVCLCEGCAGELTRGKDAKCPVCRVRIEGVRRVFV